MIEPAPDPSLSGRGPSRIIEEIHARLIELRNLGAAAPAPGLQLSVAECNTLEELTGLGTTRNAAFLIQAVARLASIRVGDIRIPFTPGQLAELAHRAEKRGHTIEAEMKAAVARIEDEIFYNKGV